MKTFATLFLFLICSLVAKSQIYFENNYKEPVWVCIGYHHDGGGFHGWVTKGWFKIEPNQTSQILEWLPTNNNIYYYAQTNGGAKSFHGSNNLLVHPTDAFTIKNADMEYVKNEHHQYQWKAFRHVNTHGTFKLKYTIQLEY